MTDMRSEEIVQVIQLWADEYEQLIALPDVQYVMTFENKGEQMGASNPHPHGQIWATGYVPSLPLRSLESQEEYFDATGRPLLLDYVQWELEDGRRVISANSSWVVVVPFWANWPFEAMILPRRQVGTVSELTAEERSDWALALKELLVRYDALFRVSFPYSMGIYQLPKNRPEWGGFSLSQSFYPPLLRSASVRKFMVGFELFAEHQRDITPEEAAARLRDAQSAP